MTLKSIFAKLRNHATTLVWLVVLAVIAVILLRYEYYVLWLVQEESLFMDTPLFFRQQMVVPGGLLVYVGCFLTQLLYHQALGVTVLCALWLLLLWMMRRTFNVSSRWALLLLVPVALLLIANVDMGYWLYPIKLKGWYFDATVGVTVVVALLWAFRALSGYRIWRRLLLVIATIAGYPLFGTYALAATVLMALWCWRLDKNRWAAVVDSILAVLTVLAIPLLYYHFVYYQTNIVNLWWAGLPIFKIADSYPVFYVPYALLGLCLVLLTVFGRKTRLVEVSVKQSGASNETAESKTLWVLSPQQKKGKAGKPALKKVTVKKKEVKRRNYKEWLQYAAVVVVLAATVYGVQAAWMKDENFHREAAMHYYVEQTRWEDVLAEAEKQQDPPTRAVVVMRNLALARLGKQSTEMYRYRNGSKKPASPFPIQMSMIAGDLLYYNYGMLNDSHHMCVEAGVEFGWRVEHLKYMARCALLAGEKNIVYKFANMLKHTLFHGEWAEWIEKLQQKPELVRNDKETSPIMHMLQYPDIVGTDHGYAEKYLMNHMAEINSDDPYFQEQSLLAALWTKNNYQFWPQFQKYLTLHPGKPIPRYFLEAAYLYAEEDKKVPFVFPIDKGMKKTYEDFMKQLPKFDGMDIEDVRSALYPMYGDTYFFEYYLMDDLKYI